MKHEDTCQAGADTDNGCHCVSDDQPNNHDNQEVPPGIDHSISPDVPCPETVLIARMTDGSYLLMAYPQREPAAFVTRENADVLQQALQGAFGSPTPEMSCNARRWHS